MKKILLFIIILISSCHSNLSEKNTFLLTSDLPAGEYVKDSGKKLINQPYGFTKIIADSAQINNTLLIVVHGYDSRGYEWITSLSNLAEKYNNTYFYRYDWEICPDKLSQNLADSLATLIQSNHTINNVIIFGHSYGGLVVTYLASELEMDIPTEIHTIAAPLAGYPRIMEKCNFCFDDSNKIIYPPWNSNVIHYQWRTQKEQDGAFKNMTIDPQEISFENSLVTVLPDSMAGHRLGHNWSVTWVIDNYLNN